MKSLLKFLFLLLACENLFAVNMIVPVGYFDGTPSTNRTVLVQSVAPSINGGFIVLSDKRKYVTDESGQFTITNIGTGLLQFQATFPPGRTDFMTFVTATDIASSGGTLNATNQLAASGTATFPSGAVAWSAAVTDSRYSRSTNSLQFGSAAFVDATNFTSNVVFVAYTNALGSFGTASKSNASAFQPSSDTLTNLARTGAVTNATAGANVSLGITNGVLTVIGLSQNGIPITNGIANNLTIKDQSQLNFTNSLGDPDPFTANISLDAAGNLNITGSTSVNAVSQPVTSRLFTATTTGVNNSGFTGNGHGLTNLQAASLTGSGTLPDATLSSNIPRVSNGVLLALSGISNKTASVLGSGSIAISSNVSSGTITVDDSVIVTALASQSNATTALLAQKVGTNTFATFTNSIGSAGYLPKEAFQPANTTLTNLARTGAITNIVAGANVTVSIANSTATIASTSSGGSGIATSSGLGTNTSFYNNNTLAPLSVVPGASATVWDIGRNFYTMPWNTDFQGPLPSDNAFLAITTPGATQQFLFDNVGRFHTLTLHASNILLGADSITSWKGFQPASTYLSNAVAANFTATTYASATNANIFTSAKVTNSASAPTFDFNAGTVSGLIRYFSGGSQRWSIGGPDPSLTVSNGVMGVPSMAFYTNNNVNVYGVLTSTNEQSRTPNIQGRMLLSSSPFLVESSATNQLYNFNSTALGKDTNTVMREGDFVAGSGVALAYDGSHLQISASGTISVAATNGLAVNLQAQTDPLDSSSLIVFTNKYEDFDGNPHNLGNGLVGYKSSISFSDDQLLFQTHGDDTLFEFANSGGLQFYNFTYSGTPLLNIASNGAVTLINSFTTKSNITITGSGQFVGNGIGLSNLTAYVAATNGIATNLQTKFGTGTFVQRWYDADGLLKGYASTNGYFVFSSGFTNLGVADFEGTINFNGASAFNSEATFNNGVNMSSVGGGSEGVLIVHSDGGLDSSAFSRAFFDNGITTSSNIMAKAVNSGSVIVTNGVTNLALTASQYVGTDANKSLVSTINGSQWTNLNLNNSHVQAGTLNSNAMDSATLALLGSGGGGGSTFNSITLSTNINISSAQGVATGYGYTQTLVTNLTASNTVFAITGPANKDAILSFEEFGADITNGTPHILRSASTHNMGMVIPNLGFVWQCAASTGDQSFTPQNDFLVSTADESLEVSESGGLTFVDGNGAGIAITSAGAGIAITSAGSGQISLSTPNESIAVSDVTGISINDINGDGITLNGGELGLTANDIALNGTPINGLGNPSGNPQDAVNVFYLTNTLGTATVQNTNFVSGQTYANGFNFPIFVSCNAALTEAAVAGHASLELRIVGNVTNYSSFETTGSTIAVHCTNVISGYVPAGASFVFTNTSSGSGNSATTFGGQIRK